MIRTFVVAIAIALGFVNLPALPTGETCGEVICNCFELNCGIDCGCWVCYEDEAYSEYLDEFTALFNSYETKWSKNGRLMLRNGDSGSFKFVAKG